MLAPQFISIALALTTVLTNGLICHYEGYGFDEPTKPATCKAGMKCLKFVRKYIDGTLHSSAALCIDSLKDCKEFEDKIIEGKGISECRDGSYATGEFINDEAVYGQLSICTQDKCNNIAENEKPKGFYCNNKRNNAETVQCFASGACGGVVKANQTKIELRCFEKHECLDLKRQCEGCVQDLSDEGKLEATVCYCKEQYCNTDNQFERAVRNML